MLAERRRDEADRSGHGADGTARSQLISATLGDWKSAPKAAKEAFEKFTQAVGKLLGGEISSEGVAASSYAVWNALAPLPPPSEDEIRRLGASQAALKPALAALEGVFGKQQGIQAVEVKDLLPHIEVLRSWQPRLNPAPTTTTHGATQKGGSTASKHSGIPGSGNGAVSTAGEYIPRWTADEAVLATCGLSLDSPSGQLLLREASGVAPRALAPNDEPRARAVAPTAEVVAAIEAEVFGGDKGLGINKEAGARWLTSWCHKVGAAVDDDSVPTRVAILLLSDARSDDTLAAELFDLLGEGVFEGIGQLLDQRRSLTANLRSIITALRETEEASSSAAATVMPSYGAGVSVMSESEKLVMKAEKKAERRRAKQGAGAAAGGLEDADANWLSRHGLREVVEEEIERETAHMKIRLGDGVEFRLGEGVGTKGALPKGTSRKTFKGYEEVRVPAVQPGAPPPGERSVLISELPEWAQLAFAGYKALNRIQSRIFATAFTSNENMLVCAPTGAGKTNIAMISVLREVAQHMRGGVIARDEFKVVYVAPMKALAAEVTASFAKRLAPLGEHAQDIVLKI